MKKITSKICSILLVIFVALMMQGCENTNNAVVDKLNIDSSAQNAGYAYTPISCNDYCGMKCIDAANMFYDAGFKTIATSAIERSVTDTRYSDGDIYSIKVGNMVNFKQYDEFDPYTKVEISYVVKVETFGAAQYEQVFVSTDAGVNDSDSIYVADNNIDPTNAVISDVTAPVNTDESVEVVLQVANTSDSAVVLPSVSSIQEPVGTAQSVTDSKMAANMDVAVSNNEPVKNTNNNSETLEVHFIDVGQGDCTLIKCGSHAMLIDAGPDSKGTAIQLYLTKQNITSLDYVLLTHYDEDHAGGADVILTKFNCDKVILPSYIQDNKSYRDVMDTMTYRNYSSTEARVGDTYSIGGATFKILAVGNNGDSNNNQSICLRVDYGNDSFLFTGDADENVESRLINSGMDIDIDVFQAGHHGSKDSNSASFISKISPTYTVISCGADNSYGHPTAEALNNLRTNSVEVFRTDEQGSIIASTKGTGITWNTVPSTSWKVGEGATTNSVSDNSPASVSSNSSTTSSTTSNTTTTNDTVTNNEAVSTNSVVENSQTNISAMEATYILNTRTKKFHYSNCQSVKQMSEKNKKEVTWTREEVIAEGYDPCGNCNP